jgi:hypothetical protein
VKDGRHPHRERLARHAPPLVAEQRGVGVSRRVGQARPMRCRSQRDARLVEADVSVAAEAEQQQVDPPRAPDRAFVPAALLFQIRGPAVQEVNAARLQVDVIEEMAVHEAALAARVGARDPDELVQVERGHAREIDGARAVLRDERSVERDRRAAGRQTEYQVGFRGNAASDVTRERTRGAQRRLVPADLHPVYVHRWSCLWY